MATAFGPFVLDGDARELRRDGVAVALTPKAFQLLEALLAARPKALSKAALMDVLWPDAVVVDANLSNLVGEIRDALGDDAREPRFIRTVHRFGYAFLAEPPASPAAGPAVAGRVRLKWVGGAAHLGIGDHVVGRDSDAPVCLAVTSVSRRHAVVHVGPDAVTIEDLGSKNGTAVNGERLTGTRALAEGDEIEAGSVRMTVRILPLPGDTETGAR